MVEGRREREHAQEKREGKGDQFTLLSEIHIHSN
jgi:hypothetical protein